MLLRRNRNRKPSSRAIAAAEAATPASPAIPIQPMAPILTEPIIAIAGAGFVPGANDGFCRAPNPGFGCGSGAHSWGVHFPMPATGCWREQTPESANSKKMEQGDD